MSDDDDRALNALRRAAAATLKAAGAPDYGEASVRARGEKYPKPTAFPQRSIAVVSAVVGAAACAALIVGAGFSPLNPYSRAAGAEDEIADFTEETRLFVGDLLYGDAFRIELVALESATP